MPADATPVLDLRQHAAAAPGRLAIVCGDRRLHYGELEALANRCAAVFRQLGLQRGDHVATLLGNAPEGLAVAWAAWRCGLYLTPMSTALASPELHYLVRDCDARAVVAGADLARLLRADDTLHWLSLHGNAPGFTALEPLLAAASPLPQADEPPGALMMYTSGTTGAPRA